MGASYSLGARDLQGYDIVFDAADIDYITALKGWPVHVSKEIEQKLKVEFEKIQKSTGKEGEMPTEKDMHNVVKQWTGDNGGVIVGVHGLFNRGKTFTLNKLAGTCLPSDRRITTKGLSFKQPERKDLRCLFLDTAGHGAPLRNIKNGPNRLPQKENTEKVKGEAHSILTPEMMDPKRTALLKKKVSEEILQHLAFELSDVIMVVLNELSWSDQEYLDSLLAKISKRKNSQQKDRYLIIIHNYYSTETIADLKRLVDDYIVGCFDVKEQIESSVDESSKTQWYKSDDGLMRHVYIARDKTEAGRHVNEKTFALIRNWINGITSERTETVVDLFCQRAHEILKSYLKQVDSVTLKASVNDKPNLNNEEFPNAIEMDKSVAKHFSFYIEVEGLKTLLFDRLYYEGFRFVLATRNQYELPMDAVMTAEGLVVVCDVPMLTKENIKCQNGPFENVVPTVTVDPLSRKAELRLTGDRRLGYYKINNEKVTDEVVLYEQKDCLVSSRHAGPIVGEVFSIPGKYDTKIKVRAIKNGVMQLFIPIAKKEEDEDDYQ